MLKQSPRRDTNNAPFPPLGGLPKRTPSSSSSSANVPSRSPRLAPIVKTNPSAGPRNSSIPTPPAAFTSPFAKYSGLPKIQRRDAVLVSEGPYNSGDVVVYELLDQNDVWQWRVARFLRVETSNERVGYVVPLVPNANLSCDTSCAEKVIPKLDADHREQARIALDALNKIKGEVGLKRAELSEIASQLQSEQLEMAQTSARIDEEIGYVAPLLEQARTAVGNISMLDLTEMRSYRTPPPIVMRVLEAVWIILEDSVPKTEVKWKEVTQFCRGNDFVPRVRDYSSIMSHDTQLYIEKTFINDPSFTAESAARASAAAGPLFQWVHAQTKASAIQVKVAPLLKKYDDAMNKLRENEAKQADISVSQANLNEKMRNATRDYQRAVLGMNFVMPPHNNSKNKETIAVDFLAGARVHCPFLEWVPSSHHPPTCILMSVIMAKCV